MRRVDEYVIDSIDIEYCLKTDEKVLKQLEKDYLCKGKDCRRLPLPSYRHLNSQNQSFCKKCFKDEDLINVSQTSSTERELLKKLRISCKFVKFGCEKIFEIIELEGKMKHETLCYFSNHPNNRNICVKCRRVLKREVLHKCDKDFAKDEHDPQNILNLEARLEKKLSEKIEKLFEEKLELMNLDKNSSNSSSNNVNYSHSSSSNKVNVNREEKEKASLKHIKQSNKIPASGEVRCLIIPCTNKLAYCCKGLNNITVTEAKNFSAQFELEGHTDEVFSILRLTEDNMVSCAGDKLVKKWDLSTRKCVLDYKGHKSAVISLAKIEDFLVSGGQDGEIIVWSCLTADIINKIAPRNDYIFSILKLEDNKIAVCSRSPSIHIFELFKEKSDYFLEGHLKDVYSITKLDQNHIVSGSSDKALILWNFKDKKCVFIEKNAHNDSIWSIIAMKNSYIVSGANDGKIKFWSVFNNQIKLLQSLDEGGHSKIVRTLTYSSGDKILSGSYDKTIILWKLEFNSKLNFQKLI